VEENVLRLEGVVVDPSGNPCYRATASGPTTDPTGLARHLAANLLAQGAADLTA
jgi:porphobilinogen deaminase